MERNLPPNNPSASWHHLSHGKFCESTCYAGKDLLVPIDSPAREMGEVSARLSPPAYFSQVYSDRKFSLDPTDRDRALNSLHFEHSSSEFCHPFGDPSRSDLEQHIGMK